MIIRVFPFCLRTNLQPLPSTTCTCHPRPLPLQRPPRSTGHVFPVEALPVTEIHKNPKQTLQPTAICSYSRKFLNIYPNLLTPHLSTSNFNLIGTSWSQTHRRAWGQNPAPLAASSSLQISTQLSGWDFLQQAPCMVGTGTGQRHEKCGFFFTSARVSTPSRLATAGRCVSSHMKGKPPNLAEDLWQQDAERLTAVAVLNKK